MRERFYNFLQNRIAQLEYEAEFGRPDTLFNRFLDWAETIPTRANGDVIIHLNYGAITILALLLGTVITVELVNRLRGGKGVMF